MELMKDILSMILGFFVESIFTLLGKALPFIQQVWAIYALVGVYYIVLVTCLAKLWKSKKKRIFFTVLVIAIILNAIGFIITLSEFGDLMKEVVSPLLN